MLIVAAATAMLQNDFDFCCLDIKFESQTRARQIINNHAGAMLLSVRRIIARLEPESKLGIA
jgi:hypothetical protein